VYFNGMFFLLAVCDIPDPDEQDVEGALGVDLGVTNIATTSDGDNPSLCVPPGLRHEIE
jgi:transposase